MDTPGFITRWSISAPFPGVIKAVTRAFGILTSELAYDYHKNNGFPYRVDTQLLAPVS